jgi:hypothetical protein
MSTLSRGIAVLAMMNTEVSKEAETRFMSYS